MNHLAKINNKELLETFSLVIQKEKEIISEVVSYVAELLKRKLYLEQGYSNLYSFLIEKYGYSGGAAYRRIQSAKVALLFPEVLSYLTQGKLNLMTLCLIEPHITKDNGQKLIVEVIGKKKEEIAYYLANQFSKPEVNKDKIRRLPVIKKESKVFHSEEKLDKKEANLFHCEKDESEEEREENKKRSSKIFFYFPPPSIEIQRPVEQVKEEQEIRRVKIEFTADEKLAKKIERAQQLLRHKYPQGKFEDIFDEALELLLEKKDPLHRHPERERRISSDEEKRSLASLGMTERKAESRYIPQTLRREVWKRDNGKCTFQLKDGKQCNEAGMLEIDHVQPFALDGNNQLENLRLLCVNHNKWRAERTFGYRI